MKNLAVVFIGFFSIFFFTSFAFAEGNGDVDYIFTLKESENEVSLNSAENVDVVSENLNIFKADFETFQKIKEIGLIEHFEEDISVELMEGYFNEDYNDEFFSEQWYFQKHNIDYANKVLGKGEGVRIGIIDSGVTIQKDFNPDKIEKGYNYINPTKTGNDISDLDKDVVRNHGTSVASIICSQGNNNEGIVGIAPNAVIVPLIIFQDGKAPVSNVITAIEEAVSIYDCDVLNMSISVPDESELLKNVIDYAEKNGVIVVASAGNDGKNKKRYPAAYDNVIGVGSVDKDFDVCSFSQRNEKVDIMAAGNDFTLVNSSGEYVSNQLGTSFSAPIISGFAALVKGKYPDVDVHSFLNILKAGSLDIKTLGRDIYSGFGVFDAMESVKFLENEKKVFVSPVFQKNGSFNIKIFDENTSGAAVGNDDVLVVAFFDEENKLIDLDITEFLAYDGFFWKKIERDLKENVKMKIFVYDSFANMLPLGNARVCDLEQTA